MTRALFRWTFIIAAICGVAGVFLTYFFVPDMTGVDLADEDADFMEYLERNGWKGVVGEDDDDDANLLGREPSRAAASGLATSTRVRNP